MVSAERCLAILRPKRANPASRLVTDRLRQTQNTRPLAGRSSSTWARRTSASQQVSGGLGGCQLAQGSQDSREAEERSHPGQQKAPIPTSDSGSQAPGGTGEGADSCPAPPPRCRGSRSGWGLRRLFSFYSLIVENIKGLQEWKKEIINPETHQTAPNC